VDVFRFRISIMLISRFKIQDSRFKDFDYVDIIYDVDRGSSDVFGLRAFRFGIGIGSG